MKTFAGLIAGLGNPGGEYEGTRHNFGFLAVDRLMEAAGGEKSCPSFKAWKDCLAWDCALVGSSPHWLVVKPLTYMNLSGRAVGGICRRFNIPPDRLLVIHDELAFPLGRMKLKFGGGTSGHNGLASIVEHLGTRDFHRLRLGIGRPASHGDGSGYVLSRFTLEELEIVNQVVDAAVQGIQVFIRRGSSIAAPQIGGFSPRNELEP